MSCWYASGMMLVHWRRNQVRMTEMQRPDPSQVTKWGKLYDQNPGIQNNQILAFAKDLGLEPIPPMSPSPGLIEAWLRDYGPLWVNGKAHITVIAGIRDTAGSDEVLVYDPASRTPSMASGVVSRSGTSRTATAAATPVAMSPRCS
jgi:hypothetical protein